MNKSRFECKNKRYLLLHCEHYGAWYAQTVCVSFILEARGRIHAESPKGTHRSTVITFDVPGNP